MRVLTTLGQSLADICIQYCGSMEALQQLLAANPQLSPDADLSPGQVIEIPSPPTDKKVVQYFTNRSVNSYVQLQEPSYASEAVAWKNRVTAAGGDVAMPAASLTEIQVMEAVSAFVNALSPIRSKIIRLNFFGGDSSTIVSPMVPLFNNTDGSITPIGSATDVNHNFDASDYDEIEGLGDLTNSSKYINTGVNPHNTSEIGLNDITLGVYNSSNSSGNYASIGASDGTNIAYLQPKTSGATVAVCLNGSAGVYSLANTNAKGMQLVTKNISTELEYYNKLTGPSPLAFTTTGKPNSNIYVFALNASGTAVYHAKAKMLGYVIAKHLNQSEYTILQTSWALLNAALGR